MSQWHFSSCSISSISNSYHYHTSHHILFKYFLHWYFVPPFLPHKKHLKKNLDYFSHHWNFCWHIKIIFVNLMVTMRLFTEYNSTNIFSITFRNLIVVQNLFAVTARFTLKSRRQLAYIHTRQSIYLGHEIHPNAN